MSYGKYNKKQKGDNMSELKKMLRELTNDKHTNSIYLREIALLMEEIEVLKDKVRDREKTIKDILKDVEEK